MRGRTVSLLALLVALFPGAACGRQARFRYEAACGDPSMESMIWFEVRGDVVRIVSTRELDLRDEHGKTMRVRIANVGSAADPSAIDALTKLIGGKPVRVFKQHWNEESAIVGEVHNSKGEDVAESLLRRGLVDFVPSAPGKYETSSYTECVRRIAEREAKQAGVGLWRARGKRAP